MINSNLKALLDEQDWESIITRLIAYTIEKLKYKKISKVYEAEDFVIEAIKRVYTGDRNWDPVKNPDICLYLSGVIDSITFAESKKSSSKIFVDEKDDKYIDVKETLESDNPTSEDEQIAKELDGEIRKEIKGNDLLEIIYEGLILGMKPNEIAKDFDLQIEDIRNDQKKLRRVVNNILKNNN